MKCIRCGIEAITYGQGLCQDCRRKLDARDRSAHFERIQLENAELEARRAHPAYRKRLHLLHGRDWIQRPYEWLGRQ